MSDSYYKRDICPSCHVIIKSEKISQESFKVLRRIPTNHFILVDGVSYIDSFLLCPNHSKQEKDKPMWRCAYCGWNKNPESSSYCAHCGRRDD